MLFVGAFPPAGGDVRGGMVTSCRALLAGGLGERLDLTLVDTTQVAVPPPPLARRAAYAAGRVARVAREIRRRPAAAMFFAAFGFSLVEKCACAWYARLLGVPSVMFVRGGPLIEQCRRSRAYRVLTRALLRGSTRIVCQGETWFRFFTEELGIPAERCAIIENWTAEGELLALAERRTYDATPARPVRVLFVGWVDAAKGVLDLIEAVARLRTRPDAPAVEVAFCGGGSAEATAAALARARGVADAVAFRGWVDGADKVAAYADADVFALPSHAEGLPNAMVEAMAAGLPVVVTPVGSVGDVIRDGVNGKVVPPRDVDALARALGELADSPDARARLGRAAHADARRRFSSERAVDRIVALVESVRAA